MLSSTIATASSCVSSVDLVSPFRLLFDLAFAAASLIPYSFRPESPKPDLLV